MKKRKLHNREEIQYLYFHIHFYVCIRSIKKKKKKGKIKTNHTQVPLPGTPLLPYNTSYVNVTHFQLDWFANVHESRYVNWFDIPRFEKRKKKKEIPCLARWKQPIAKSSSGIIRKYAGIGTVKSFRPRSRIEDRIWKGWQARRDIARSTSA